MRFNLLFATLLPLALGDLLGAAEQDKFGLEARAAKKTVCAKGVHIIACSGHGATEYGGGKYGLLITTIGNITARIPKTSSFSVPYNKSTTDFPVALNGGEAQLQQYIEEHIETCPGTPLVLVGYSEGAMITMNTLCGNTGQNRLPLNSSYAEYIIATVVYGDETRIPYQPYDLGTCTRGEGVEPRQNAAGCDAFENNMQSYCDRPDPECCGGNNQSVHYTYPATYDYDVANFVYDQWEAWLEAHPRTTTTTTKKKKKKHHPRSVPALNLRAYL